MSTTAEQLFQKLKTMPTNQLDALTEPPLSDEEGQAEIQAARSSKCG
mgnify:CR=1 FL=1